MVTIRWKLTCCSQLLDGQLDGPLVLQIQSSTDNNLMVGRFTPAHLLLLLMPLVSALSVTPQFQLAPDYISTGTAVLDTAPYYSNSSADSLNQISFAVTFGTSIPSSYSAVTSLNSLKYDIISDYRINVTTTICNFYTSGLNICLLSRSLSQIMELSCRYLAINDPNYKIYHFYYAARFYVQNQGSNSFNVMSPIASNFGVATGMNTTGTIRSFTLLSGFNASSDASYLFDIKITASYPSASVFRVVQSSGATSTIQLSSVIYSLIGYNEEESQSWPFPAIRVTFSTFNPGAPFASNTSLLQEYNTFWGLTWLNISSTPSLQFNSTLAPSTSISASSTNSPSSFEWTALLFQFKYCNVSTTPYYMVSQDLCYDICPNRYYQSNAQMTCQACVNYDCLKCLSNGTCSTCDNGTDHRQLNAYGRCAPVGGYYESNVAVALPCFNSCRTCTAGTASDCTGCYDGDYLSGGSCLPCMANCSICSNASSCSNCSGGLVSDGAGGCTYPYACPSISNCSTCNNFTGCSACLPGYNLTNASSCSSVCGDGIWVLGQQCDDNNTAGSDGCSPTCVIEPSYYCINQNASRSSCFPCRVGCLNCTNSAACTLCDSNYLLLSILTGDICFANCSNISLCLNCHYNSTSLTCSTCAAGYTVGNNSCLPLCGDNLVLAGEECDDGNTVNGDGCSQFCLIEDNFICIIVINSSVCTQCLGGTYQATNKSACLPCANYDCSKCLGNGSCTSCNTTTNRYLNSTTERCLPLSGYYDDGINTVAPPCEPTCLTCNGGGSANCVSCSVGRVIDAGKCNPCAAAAGVGCSECAVSGSNFTCTKCEGSTLSSGSCVFDLPAPSAPSLLPIILGVVGAMLLCCCCLILFCLWRRRRNEQNKVVEEQPENEVVVQQNEPTTDPFDEKLLTKNKKKKYRGEGKPEQQTKKKRRSMLVHDTEENQLSMEEFKETMPVIPKKRGKDPFKGVPDRSHVTSGGPLIVSRLEEPIADAQEADIEIASQKHVVSSGVEQLPPEPKKEEVQYSQQPSQNSDIFKSQVSDDFASGRGR